MVDGVIYSSEGLKEYISALQLHDVKRILETIRKQKQLYGSVEYLEILCLITTRLIELSHENRAASLANATRNIYNSSSL
ncbi:hypothetical protein SAE01_43740 [Segetibacter aerophilus]|uniref:Uncharacterized protein n=1 Tax=Segetibacter aerophilus TaxID=670293 RepID=A0A512BIT8_9BACT|nr:hypothetical protein SAE01_43740 [Segetibacter aerophilus]